jgi:hypothetical protein
MFSNLIDEDKIELLEYAIFGIEKTLEHISEDIRDSKIHPRWLQRVFERQEQYKKKLAEIRKLKDIGSGRPT